MAFIVQYQVNIRDVSLLNLIKNGVQIVIVHEHQGLTVQRAPDFHQYLVFQRMPRRAVIAEIENADAAVIQQVQQSTENFLPPFLGDVLHHDTGVDEIELFIQSGEGIIRQEQGRILH